MKAGCKNIGHTPVRCSQAECAYERCPTCERAIGKHECSGCEHRDVKASYRCESCNQPSEDLVAACVNLRGGNTDRIYPADVRYLEYCENCNKENPRYVTATGYCASCEPVKPRLGVVCPDCANRLQHYCVQCNKPVDDRNESMTCVSCMMEKSFAAVKHSVNHHRICQECTRTGPVNSTGVCKECYKKRGVRSFYLTRPYATKCKTCDEPASTDKGYCRQCDKQLINCVKCSTPTVRPKMTCGHHDYNCCACGNKFSPKDMTEVTCPYCIEFSKREKRCAKCDGTLDKEGEYLSSGLCDNCHEATVDELTCRRCGTEKGWDICPKCFPEKYPCMMCEKNVVHSTQFVCTDCDNKRNEQR